MYWDIAMISSIPQAAGTYPEFLHKDHPVSS